MSKKKKNYRFLIAWLDDSDSAGGPTGIHGAEDLEPQLALGNDHVSSWDFSCASIDEAYLIGVGRAFRENYTAHDSVSAVITL